MVCASLPHLVTSTMITMTMIMIMRAAASPPTTPPITGPTPGDGDPVSKVNRKYHATLSMSLGLVDGEYVMTAFVMFGRSSHIATR